MRRNRRTPTLIALELLKLRSLVFLKFIQRDQESRFGHFIGAVESMKELAQQFGKRFLKGQAAAATLFQSGLTSSDPIQ